MKKLNLLICAALLSIAVPAFAESSPSPSAPGSPSASPAQNYTCPMHPEIVQGKPGKCPKCGMNLELKKEEPKQ